jgi:hypothetical protein
MKIKILTAKDLPLPSSTLKFRIKNTMNWRVGYTDENGADFIQEVNGILYNYSWNQIDEYFLTEPVAGV